MIRLFLALAPLFLAFASLFFALALPALAADNPHDRADGCLACHEGTLEAVGAPRPSVATCSGCHAASARDMHAVGVVPPDYVHVPAAWPLEDGRVVCATCHAEPSCDASRAREAPYHRGAPYTEPQGFCWECHRKEDFGRSNPHHPGPGDDDGTCTACHVRPPQSGAAPDDADLRVEPGEVCAFCHGTAGHLGTATHLGAQASTTALPLDHGTVACWTCHDVHAAAAPPPARPRPGGDAVHGLASEAWPGLVKVSSKPEHPPMLALPLNDGALCAACHGEGP